MPLPASLIVSDSLIGIGLALSSLESIAARTSYGHGGIFDCALISRRLQFRRLRPMGALWRQCHQPAGILALHLLRLAAGCSLLYPGLPVRVRGIAALIGLATCLPTALIFPRSMDGADQMTAIVLSGLAAAQLWPGSFLVTWAIIFIAVQACLAYFTSGVIKAIAPGWRSGAVLTDIISGQLFGDPAVGAWLAARPTAARALSLTLIVWECAFPLVLVAPLWALVAFFASGALFHLISARIIGLNHFLWPFLATYPPIFALNRLLTSS